MMKTRYAKMPTIEVCHGPKCSDDGGRSLSLELEAIGLKSFAGDCRDQCPNSPMVLVDKRMITNATLQKIQTRLQDLQEQDQA